MELNVPWQILFHYTDHINLSDEITSVTKIKELGLEIKGTETKYIIISRHRNMKKKLCQRS